MNFFILSLVSAVVLLGTGSCFTIKQNSSDVKEPIIGGDISREIVPYHVSMKCNDVYFCGGALISPQHVLTAAHCIIHMIEEKCVVKVLAGSNYKHGGEYIEVAKGEAHPGYSENRKEHDIGIIKLKYPFPLSERIYPVDLAPYPPRNHEKMIVTGYGRVSPVNNLSSDVLKIYASGVLTYEECYNRLGNGVHPSDFCDSGIRDIGTCQGDSGSPVVNNDRYLIGVVSRGVNINKPKDPVKDCAFGTPNMFASVYYHMDFINAWLNAWSSTQ